MPDKIDAGSDGEIGKRNSIEATAVSVPVHIAGLDVCAIEDVLYNSYVSIVAGTLNSRHKDNNGRHMWSV